MKWTEFLYTAQFRCLIHNRLFKDLTWFSKLYSYFRVFWFSLYAITNPCLKRLIVKQLIRIRIMRIICSNVFIDSCFNSTFVQLWGNKINHFTSINSFDDVDTLKMLIRHGRCFLRCNHSFGILISF